MSRRLRWPARAVAPPMLDPRKAESDRAEAMPASLAARRVPGRAWIAVELFARAGDRARLARSHALSRASGLPLVAAGDVHMHVRARRALQDTLTAIRAEDAAGRMRPCALSERRAPPALARAACADLSAGAARRDARDRRALHVSRSTSCATNTRRRSCRPARRRPRSCASSPRRDSRATAIRDRASSRRCPRADRARARADRRACATSRISSPSTTSSRSRARRTSSARAAARRRTRRSATRSASPRSTRRG